MDQLLEKIDQLLSGHTALIDGMTEHVMGRYVRQLENFNRQLDTFKRGMLERVHDMESKSTKLENQIGKSNYLLGKLEKEIERRKDLIERLNKDFEENRQIGQTETEKELRKFRKDAAERMLTEFKEVAIAERDVETIIDMIHEIYRFRDMDAAVRAKFMKLVNEVIGDKMDIKEKETFAANSNELGSVTTEINEKFGVLETAANEMKKRVQFMRNLHQTKIRQEKEKQERREQEEKRKANFLFQP